MIAASGGFKRIVQQLVAAGADADAVQEDGVTVSARRILHCLQWQKQQVFRRRRIGGNSPSDFVAV